LWEESSHIPGCLPYKRLKCCGVNTNNATCPHDIDVVNRSISNRWAGTAAALIAVDRAHSLHCVSLEAFLPIDEKYYIIVTDFKDFQIILTETIIKYRLNLKVLVTQ
jgi:hypothetical protein